MDLDDLRTRFGGTVFDERPFELAPERLVAFAKACGEVQPRFTNADDADFQALPTFVSSFQPGRRLPKGFPKLPGLGMDGGKVVTIHAPLKAPQTVTGRTHIEDIYRKTGRSGTMIFIVLRTSVYSAEDALLASSDTNMVIRERPKRESASGEGDA